MRLLGKARRFKSNMRGELVTGEIRMFDTNEGLGAIVGNKVKKDEKSVARAHEESKSDSDEARIKLNSTQLVINVDRCEDVVDEVLAYVKGNGNTIIVSTENELSDNSIEKILRSKANVIVEHTTKQDKRLSLVGDNLKHTAMCNFILGPYGYEAMDVSTSDWVEEISEMHGVPMQAINNQQGNTGENITDMTAMFEAGKTLTGIEDAPSLLEAMVQNLKHKDLNTLHDYVMKNDFSEQQLLGLIAAKNGNTLIVDWEKDFIASLLQAQAIKEELDDICTILQKGKLVNTRALPGIELNFITGRSDNCFLSGRFVDVAAMTNTRWFKCLQGKNSQMRTIELEDIKYRYAKIGLKMHKLKELQCEMPKDLIWEPKNEKRGAYQGEPPKEQNPNFEGKVFIGSGRGFGKCNTINGVADTGHDGLHGVNTELITTKGSTTSEEWKRVCDEIAKAMEKFHKKNPKKLISVTSNAVCYATDCHTINVCSRGNEITTSMEVHNIPCDLRGYELANVRVYALTGILKAAVVQIRNGNMSPGTTSNITWHGLMASHSKYGAEVSCYTGHSEDMDGLGDYFRNESPLSDLRGYEECILNQCLLARQIRVTVKEVYGKLRYDDNEIYLNGWGMRPAIRINTLNGNIEEYEAGYEASRWGFAHIRCASKHSTVDFIYGANSTMIMTWRPTTFNETIILNKEESMQMMYSWHDSTRSGLIPGFKQAVGAYTHSYVPLNCEHGQQPYIRGTNGSIVVVHNTNHMHRCWERTCRGTQNKGIHGLNYKEVLMSKNHSTNLHAAEYLIDLFDNIFRKTNENIKLMVTANHTYQSPGYHVINLTTGPHKFEVIQLPGMTEVRIPGVSGRALAHLRLCALFTKTKRKFFMMNGTTIANWEKDVYELENNNYLKEHDWCSINQVVPSHFCAGGFGYSGILRGKLEEFLNITSKGAHIYGVEEAMIGKQLAHTTNTCFEYPEVAM
nr:hypothetical protein [Rhizoctonia solani endornavirus 11]